MDFRNGATEHVLFCMVLAGMLLSCVYSLPTGAGIVAVNLLVFIVFSAIGALRA